MKVCDICCFIEESKAIYFCFFVSSSPWPVSVVLIILTDVNYILVGSRIWKQGGIFSLWILLTKSHRKREEWKVTLINRRKVIRTKKHLVSVHSPEIGRNKNSSTEPFHSSLISESYLNLKVKCYKCSHLQVNEVLPHYSLKNHTC